jgi:activating signal cointegrator complex subunit 3
MKLIKKSVVELSGDFTPDVETLNKADIIVTTPEKWDGITRGKDRQYTKKVGLVIFDEIHLLGQERGAVLEVIVSRMNKEAKVRMVGLSTAMANGTDVAEWFGSDQFGFFNFRPTVRPVPIEIHFEGFSEKHYCPRMATMNKPAYNHIKKYSDSKPVIIFVSSRRQTRLTANDLISYAQMDNNPTGYVRCDIKTIQKAV